jgi:hypothetical protein
MALFITQYSILKVKSNPMIGRSTNYFPPIQDADQLKGSSIDTISDFFWQYPLEETQSRIWSWYIDAVQNPEVNAGDLVLFFDKLSQLLRAVYAFYENRVVTDRKSIRL